MTIQGKFSSWILRLAPVFILFLSPLRYLADYPAPPRLPAAEGEIFLPLVSQQVLPPPPWCGPPEIPPDDLANEQVILDGLNEQRNVNGKAMLALAGELTQAARRHSRDMADNNFTDHTGSDGANGGQRMEDACYHWSTWAEIIGWGFGGDPSSMIEWWMNSPIHHDIILSTKYEDFGAGYAYNSSSDWNHYWTVNFGKRAINPTIQVQMYDCVYTSIGSLGGSMLVVHSETPCRDYNYP